MAVRVRMQSWSKKLPTTNIHCRRCWQFPRIQRALALSDREQLCVCGRGRAKLWMGRHMIPKWYCLKSFHSLTPSIRNPPARLKLNRFGSEPVPKQSFFWWHVSFIFTRKPIDPDDSPGVLATRLISWGKMCKTNKTPSPIGVYDLFGVHIYI